MKKVIALILSIILFVFSFHIAAQPETKTQHDARMQWWREARFGMFIHWGLYSIPAGEWNGKTGYGEWIRTSAEIPIDTYDKFISQFNPVKFNADEWVRMARDAGMKYIVITSKHHDGYCNFDTKQTGFCVRSTPFKRDPMKELAEACRKYGLKFCFYYSIMDWHHPDYLPRREWEKNRSAEGADFTRYVQYMKNELKELLTNYGEIGVLWFDGEWERTWNEKWGKEIYTYCRSLQPNIIINNRVGAGRMDMEGLTKEGMFGGDFGTPEQQIPATGLPGVDWETCMTMNDHWGYNKNDKNFKSAKELIQTIADIASKGGNYLLNVGPTAEGLIPQESVERLKEIGEWMKTNGEAIHNTQASPFKKLDLGRCTRKDISGGVRLYFHIFDWPADKKLVVPGCLNTPDKAFLLADPNKSELNVNRKEDALVISLPDNQPDKINIVVVLDLKGKLDLTNPPDINAEFNIFVNKLTVRFNTDRENVQIRYTLDGTEPVSGSKLYEGTLILDKSATVTARCFRGEKAVSGNARKEFSKVTPMFALPKTNLKQGIEYQYYEGDWDIIPLLITLKPVKTGILKNFTLSPAVAKEYYAFNIEGYINIPTTDTYAFYTESDDGSNLYIDNLQVVDNDGLHGMKEVEGDIPLTKGFHKIRVEFIQKTGSAGLNVSIRSTSMKKQPIPSEWLYY